MTSLLAALLAVGLTASDCGTTELEMEIWPVVRIENAEQEAFRVTVTDKGCMHYVVPDHLRAAGQYTKQLTAAERARLHDVVDVRALSSISKQAEGGQLGNGPQIVDGEITVVRYREGSRMQMVWYPNVLHNAQYAAKSSPVQAIARTQSTLIDLTGIRERWAEAY